MGLQTYGSWKALKLFLKGLKGDAGTKGALGRFGARGPVGQKVSTASLICLHSNNICLPIHYFYGGTVYEIVFFLAGRPRRARTQWSDGKLKYKCSQISVLVSGNHLQKIS